MITGFTVQNWKKRLALIPAEDGYSTGNKVFAVADGVTRDPSEWLPDTTTLTGKFKFAWGYPHTSPAKDAAEIFCKAFQEVLKDYSPKNRADKAIYFAIEEANKQIAKYNSINIPNCDYLTQDLAGCVAAGCSVNGNLMSWGFLTDCGIAIFDKDGNLKFRTENQGPDKYDKEIWQDPRLKNIGWENPEARRIIRRDYRNNPANPCSFGVLTGQDSAMSYVRVGNQELKPSECFIVYSDGLEHVVYSNEFADLLKQNNSAEIKKLCARKVRTEGTLILSK